MRDDITAKVIASSVCATSGARLDTLQLRYPRIIHAEFMTHRMFSRNASSSRAIPVATMAARGDIFIPKFAKNKPGMQAGAELSSEDQEEAQILWEDAAANCLEAARQLSQLGVHKQWANRMLEWFGYIDVLVSSTTWSNWDALRDHSDAQPEIEDLAKAMKIALSGVSPTILGSDDWHLPYVDDNTVDDVMWAVDQGKASEFLEEIRFAFVHTGLIELDNYTKLLIAVSAARACRVSYAKHDGVNSTLAEDIRRFCLLSQSTPKHASPLEHMARPLKIFDDPYLQGNYEGFSQFRKYIPGENL